MYWWEQIVMKNTRAIVALLLREMTASYGRNPGGYLWAIIEPVAALALLTAVFSMFFRTPALGDNFPLFYATGYLPFMMYNDVSSKVAQSIRYSRQLLFYPPVNFLHAIIARAIINLITHIVIFILIITVIKYMYDLSLDLNYLNIIIALCMTASLALGLGCFNCFLATRFPVWERIWAIANRPAFIISGIFFIIDDIPEPFKSYLWFNPLIHVVGKMRSGFYPYYEANYVSYLFVFLISLFLFFIGLILLSRQHRFLLNNL